MISTAATHIGHRHICRFRRTKKSRSHSEPVDVHWSGWSLPSPSQTGRVRRAVTTQNNCMDGHQISPDLSLWWTKSQSEGLETHSVHIDSIQQDKHARFSTDELFKTCGCLWHNLSSMPVMSDGAEPDRCIYFLLACSHYNGLSPMLRRQR